VILVVVIIDAAMTITDVHYELMGNVPVYNSINQMPIFSTKTIQALSSALQNQVAAGVNV
jgi:hypothetical protein